jgi:hypothetical protein
MKLWKWVAIGSTVSYISMASIMARTGDVDGISFQTVSVLYVVIGVSAVFIADKIENVDKESLVKDSERFEKVERICNQCNLDGGKMKCPYYRNPQAVITKCYNSKNPDGKNE